MVIPYQWRKAVINACQIFTGVVAVKLAPYAGQLSVGVIPADLLTPDFWRKLFFFGVIITGTAEFRYFYKWLMSLNGGNDVPKDVPKA